ncbi:MAG: SOS response-associated peptidase [Saprospiraceae bacterium]|nr:SOS response-associated peptidase [Saprospiraceae bacterium]
MCGRFSFSTSREKIQEEFGVRAPKQLEISFNIAPTQQAYVITNKDPESLARMNWGLVPPWSKEGRLTGKMINARSEGIFTKPSFRIPIRKKRCLVPGDSFYEWVKEGKKKKPFRIFPKSGSLFAFAGIWEYWSDEKTEIFSFSILTCDANKEVSAVHDRMPLFFEDEESRKNWLSDIPLPEIEKLLKMPADGILDMYRVTDKANSPSYNESAIHKEVYDPPTLF